KPQRTVPIHQLIVQIVFRSVDRHPADNRRTDAIDDPVRDIKQRDAFGSKKVLVRVGRKCIDAIIFDVEFQTAKALNRIDHKYYVPVAAESSDVSQIGSKAAAKLHPTDGHRSGAFIYQR